VKVGLKFEITQHLGLSIFYPNFGSNNLHCLECSMHLEKLILYSKTACDIISKTSSTQQTL